MTAIASRFQVWDEENSRPGQVAVQGGPVGSMAAATIGVGSVDVFASWSRRRGETHQKAGASAPRCHQPAPPPPVAPSIDPVLFTLAIHHSHQRPQRVFGFATGSGAVKKRHPFEPV